MNLNRRIALRDPEPPALGPAALVVLGAVWTIATAIKLLLGTLL